MSGSKKKNKVYKLLLKIDEGYTPTDEEVAELKKIKKISFPDEVEIPKSIGLLTSLQELNLRWTKITNLSGIKKLTSLQTLDLMGTNITP